LLGAAVLPALDDPSAAKPPEEHIRPVDRCPGRAAATLELGDPDGTEIDRLVNVEP
jgi:hypothetical protein